jgi:hypothetical protein
MKNVVHEAAASVHRNLDAGHHKLAGESLGGESGALIGIENPRLSEPKQRLLRRRRAEARIVGVRQPPHRMVSEDTTTRRSANESSTSRKPIVSRR